MIGSEETRKHMYAVDVATVEGFEWDYFNADPDDLYEAIEAIGWQWNGTMWEYKA